MIDTDMSVWRGRVDSTEGERALRWHQVVRPCGAGCGPGIAIVGFASDEGVRRNQGRVGAAAGPRALRQQLANLPARSGLALFDAGTVSLEGGDLETGQAEYAALVGRLLGQGHLPLGLGGGHEIAYGTFLGLAEHLASEGRAPRLGVLNLDSHFDLRVCDRPTSGTPFRQIASLCGTRGWPFRYAALGVSSFSNTDALFETARSLGVKWRLDETMGLEEWPRTAAFITDFLEEVEALYLTICLDVLPPADAPGVSAPSARGVPLEVVEKVIGAACATGKLRAADVAELNPRLDTDNRTARVAARIVGRVAALGARRA